MGIFTLFGMIIQFRMDLTIDDGLYGIAYNDVIVTVNDRPIVTQPVDLTIELIEISEESRANFQAILEKRWKKGQKPTIISKQKLPTSPKR